MSAALHVSVVVGTVSRTIENTLHRQDTAFADPALAVAHRAAIEQWIALIPVPGQAWQEPVDKATQQALQLPHILAGRDPSLFGRWYEDAESEAALLERRPYDAERAA